MNLIDINKNEECGGDSYTLRREMIWSVQLERAILEESACGAQVCNIETMPDFRQTELAAGKLAMIPIRRYFRGA